MSRVDSVYWYIFSIAPYQAQLSRRLRFIRILGLTTYERERLGSDAKRSLFEGRSPKLVCFPFLKRRPSCNRAGLSSLYPSRWSQASRYLKCVHAASVAIDSYLDDSSGYRGVADRVFLPATVEELREIVRASAKDSVPLTVSGAGTGLAGARVPHGGWVVSLERFREIKVEHGRARRSRSDSERSASRCRPHPPVLRSEPY